VLLCNIVSLKIDNEESDFLPLKKIVQNMIIFYQFKLSLFDPGPVPEQEL
jgi:hypothetical protein